MGVDMTSSRIMVAKTGISTSEWRNFCIWTLIDVILTPLEMFVGRKWWCANAQNFYPQKMWFDASKCSWKVLDPQFAKLGPTSKNGLVS